MKYKMHKYLKKIMFKINRIYVIYIINVDYMLTVKRFIIAVVKINDFIKKKKLLIIFIDLINVFDQKEINILLLYNKNVYMINLNSSELLFKSLYNLLISELKIIRMYLNIVRESEIDKTTNKEEETAVTQLWQR